MDVVLHHVLHRHPWTVTCVSTVAVKGTPVLADRIKASGSRLPSASSVAAGPSPHLPAFQSNQHKPNVKPPLPASHATLPAFYSKQCSQRRTTVPASQSN